MASISLRAAQKAYGDAPPVIRNVDLDIGEHEFCVFLARPAAANPRCCG
jgi:multiple sugar transport system ATP-binding protein